MAIRPRIVGGALAALAATGFPAPAAQARPSAATQRAPALDTLAPVEPLDDTSWVLSGIAQHRRYRLVPGPAEPWLERYLRPASNHTPEWRRYFQGRYGARSWRVGPSFRWGALLTEDEAPAELPWAEEIAELREPARVEPLSLEGVDVAPLWPLEVESFPEPEALSIALRKPCPKWREPRPLTVMRYAGESDRFPLLDCDGGIAPEALDRLSVLSRPPDTTRPELPLPLEPEAWRELGDVRLLDPRLVWLVHQIGLAFPGHAIVLYSGYRKDAHSGLHHQGRALDLAVHGVPNEHVFAVCKALRDVGCGYYPENKFVHVDVRPYGTRRVLWVDVSPPGTASRYVDGWPGVVEPGSVWLGPGH